MTKGMINVRLINKLAETAHLLSGLFLSCSSNDATYYLLLQISNSPHSA